MIASPFDQFLLQAIPDAEEIISFKCECGRSKVFWVHFRNTQGKVSRFLKKKVSEWIQKIYQQFNEYNWINPNTVESPSGETYEVSQAYCSCPDFQYSVNKGKSWRSFCKHQLMQLINKSLAEQIKPEPRTEDTSLDWLRRFRSQKSQLITKLDAIKKDTFFYENCTHYGLSYRLNTVRLGDAQFSVTVGRDRVGRILIDSYTSAIKLFLKKSSQPLEFGDSIDAITFLLKDVPLFSIIEQQAMNSLF